MGKGDTMNIGKWQSYMPRCTEPTKGSLNITEDGYAEVKLHAPYSMVNIASEVSDFETDKYFNIDLKYEGKIDKFKVLAYWSKNGNMCLREYFNSDVIIPMEGADKVIVQVLMYGKEGEVKIAPLNITYGEKIKERKATVAAICIDGFVSQHGQRTCEDNLNETLQRIDDLCADQKPDIVVATETFYSRNITKDPYDETFLRLDSPEIKKIQDAAAKHGIYIAFSIREEHEDGYRHNACIVIDRKGEIICDYHKTHLTREETIMGLREGDEAMVIDTDFGKCGIAICWDLFYPEFAKTLVKKGAEIIINPSAGFHVDMHTVRAKDSGVYIVTGGPYRTSTAVIDPSGTILADGVYTGAAVAEIDLNKRFPVFPAYSERRSVYFNELREDLYI